MTEEVSLFDKIKKTRGSVANIHLGFKDFPEGIHAHFDFYRDIMLEENLPLSREHREFLAVKTSRSNECPYCIEHHEAALRHHTSENLNDFNEKNSQRELLSLLASTLTKEPWKASNLKEKFLQGGFSDSQWQHAIMVVSYFNMANRFAFALNLELEEDFELSCK